MKRTISLNTPQLEKEALLVEGVWANDTKAQSGLYAYCADYFWANFRGVFFAKEEVAQEIFQNAFIALWENIERHKIYAYQGRLMGKEGKPLTSNLLTYFMGIARIKYLEWTRECPTFADPDTEMGRLMRQDGFDAQQYIGMLYDNDAEHCMLDIVADVISHMSERCRDILSKFYYEEKDLDTILQEVPQFESKNALKTQKYKCMEKLRATARSIYQQYLNA